MQAKTLIVLAILLAVAALVAVVVIGCTSAKPEHHIDYNEQASYYEDAPVMVREGTKVKLYFTAIGTDTDYAFFLDDERLETDYDPSKGFIIKFTMPDHDVSLRVESYSSMFYMPVPGNDPGTEGSE